MSGEKAIFKKIERHKTMIKDTLHLRAPGNWINDPNGFIYYKGKYHLFYQYFPYAPIWGTMHWGHAVSEDLVHWEHQGVALFPSKEYDRNGVFSGSAIEVDGKLHLYYSAVQYLRQDPENIHQSLGDSYLTSQAMLVSEDGEKFDNWDHKRQIVPVIADCAFGDAKDTRDPKVWKDGSDYYMILGSTWYKEQGRVLFYTSKDARNWKYRNQCRIQEMGSVMECPDLFCLDGQYIFVGSPMELINDGINYSAHAIWARADFNCRTCALELTDSYHYIDYGLDFYAPQTTLDSEGRRVIIGWMRMPQAVEESSDGRGTWNGMMSIPRLVEIGVGHLYFPIHPSVDAFYTKDVTGKRRSRNHVVTRKGPYRIKARLQEGQSLDIGGYQIWMEKGAIKTDRSRVFCNISNHRLTAETPKVGGDCRLDIFVDVNLIEIFVNNGEYVISHVVYGLGDSVDGEIDGIFVGIGA